MLQGIQIQYITGETQDLHLWPVLRLHPAAAGGVKQTTRHNKGHSSGHQPLWQTQGMEELNAALYMYAVVY